MSDDLREREPRRDQGDLPPEDGTRSDHAGSGAGAGTAVGPAPAGGSNGSEATEGAPGGTPDGTDERGGPGPQTDWLRGA